MTKSDWGQAAFDAGKQWASLYHESGVANARVVTYGFSKWFNSFPPRSGAPTKKYLLESFREGFNIGKRKNPVSSLTGKWIPAHAVRILPTGQVQVLKEKNPGRKIHNVEMGFRDRQGIFHPIRASEDYEEGIVGTHPVSSKKRRKKPVAKKRKAVRRKKR